MGTKFHMVLCGSNSNTDVDSDNYVYTGANRHFYGNADKRAADFNADCNVDKRALNQHANADGNEATHYSDTHGYSHGSAGVDSDADTGRCAKRDFNACGVQ